jgi:hypothetical protein
MRVMPWQALSISPHLIRRNRRAILQCDVLPPHQLPSDGPERDSEFCRFGWVKLAWKPSELDSVAD